MKNILNTKILLSGATIVAAAALIIGATFAFFSDTETSTGNVFAAGEIDLQIDNESYVTDINGDLVFSEETSWEPSDLTDQLFFDFGDLKPGDFGEDTISILAGSNDAWACMAVDMTATPDNGITDPEADAGDETDGENGGELQDYLEFAWWTDDGDNVFEIGEEIGWTGPAGEEFDGSWQRLADSTGGFFDNDLTTGGDPITGGNTVYVAKAWCFGELTQTPIAQDGVATDGPIAPGREGTGFTCNGAGDGDQNDAQTDSIEADISFYAIQARNNGSFLCSSLPPFVGEGGDEDRPTVGAALADYDQPTGLACDVTVDDSGGANFTTIQAAINDAGTTAGETVCVAAGTYNEDVTVNKSIRLAGAGPTSIVNGQTAGFGGTVTVTADNVTLEGFAINGIGGANDTAVYLSTVNSGDVVRFNTITAGGGASNAFLTDGGQSNHTISNNVFGGTSAQLVYVNGFADVSVVSTNVDFTNNDFDGTATGPLLGINADNSAVTLNDFNGTAGTNAAGTFEDSNVFNQNNFTSTGLIELANADTGTLNAEDNWWGDLAPADNVSGNVDFTPFETSAFPEN